MRYFVRTSRPPAAAGPFDLERARARLRAALRAERQRGHTLHEGQRGIWLVAGGDDGDTGLFWIADEDDAIVRLDDARGQAVFLQ